MSAQRGSHQRTEPTLNAKPLLERMTFDNVRDTPYAAPPKPPVRYLRWLLVIFVLTLALAAYQESRLHFYQSTFWHWLAQKLSYRIENGASAQISFPNAGPFDKRYGYHQLPLWQTHLIQNGFNLSAQSRFSAGLQRYSNWGFNPPFIQQHYPALSLQGCKQDLLYQFNAPALRFNDLAEVAPVIVQSLLFIEDRDLLSPKHPRANPVVNLPRLGAATWSQLQRAIGIAGVGARPDDAIFGHAGAIAGPAVGVGRGFETGDRKVERVADGAGDAKMEPLEKAGILRGFTAPVVLATSSQPCCQCYGATIWAGIDRLLIGASAMRDLGAAVDPAERYTRDRPQC